MNTDKVMGVSMSQVQQKWHKELKFNKPFLGSHTNNKGKISSGYISPPGLPTYQVLSKSERVMCKTSVNCGITLFETFLLDLFLVA